MAHFIITGVMKDRDKSYPSPFYHFYCKSLTGYYSYTITATKEGMSLMSTGDPYSFNFPFSSEALIEWEELNKK